MLNSPRRPRWPSTAIVLEAAAVITGAIALAVIITWPTVAHLTTEIPGAGSGGDRSGYAWDVWYLQQYGLDLWGVNEQDAVSEPFKRTLPAALNTLQLTFVGPAWLASQFVGPIAALNLAVLLLIATSAASMYLLVRTLGAGMEPAVWAAVAYTVFPNALLRASVHYPLTAMACFPLLLLVGWRWYRNPGRLNSVLFALGTAFCWLSNPYYGTMALVIATVIGVAGVVRLITFDSLRAILARASELAAAMIALVALPLAALFWSAQGAVESTLTRSRVELEIYGARVSDYLLPDAQQETFRWLLGADRLTEIAAPGGERANFVGYLTLLLGIAAIVLGIRGWSRLSARYRAVIATAPPLAVVLVWFSLATPTRWWGVEIPTPSDAVFEALPFLRVYARFAVPVSAGLICLAAVGLAMLIKDRPRPIRLGAVAVAIVISLLELPAGGGFPSGSDRPLVVGSEPPREVPMWRWLRTNAESDALVYNFPATQNELVERFHMYGQVVHGKSIVNGDATHTGIGTDVTSSDPDPREPESPGRLGAIGVDYVTVNPAIYGVAGLEAPSADDPPPGYYVEEVFDDGSAVWGLSAPPDDAVAYFRRQEWWPPERFDDGREWRWLRETGRMAVYASEAGRYRISFGLRNVQPQVPRRLRIELPDGRVVTRAPATGRDATLVAVLPAGRSEVRVSLEGAPPIQPPGDPRVLSLAVSDWSFERL